MSTSLSLVQQLFVKKPAPTVPTVPDGNEEERYWRNPIHLRRLDTYEVEGVEQRVREKRATKRPETDGRKALNEIEQLRGGIRSQLMLGGIAGALFGVGFGLMAHKSPLAIAGQVFRWGSTGAAICGIGALFSDAMYN